MFKIGDKVRYKNGGKIPFTIQYVENSDCIVLKGIDGVWFSEEFELDLSYTPEYVTVEPVYENNEVAIPEVLNMTKKELFTAMFFSSMVSSRQLRELNLRLNGEPAFTDRVPSYIKEASELADQFIKELNKNG